MYNVTFNGGETAGSISKRQLRNNSEIPPKVQTPQADTVNFRGHENNEGKKKTSIGAKIIGLVTTAALIIGGLGLAHKHDVVGKLKDGKFKDFMRKSDTITKPCHEWCAKGKKYAIETYEKIKNYFKKS